MADNTYLVVGYRQQFENSKKDCGFLAFPGNISTVQNEKIGT